MTLEDDLMLAVVVGIREQMKRVVRERREKGEIAAFLMTSPDSAILVLPEGSVAFKREGRGFLPTPPLADVTDFGGVPIEDGPPKLTLEGPLRAILAVIRPTLAEPRRTNDDEKRLAATVKLEGATAAPLVL